MKDHEMTLSESLASNDRTANLIAAGLDNFDLVIAEQANDLAEQVSQHRNINRKAAAKIVAGFLEANTK